MSLESDLTRLSLIAEAKAGGASWAVIGRTLGTPAKVAKRDAKRLAKKTSRAAWQQENTREAVLRPWPDSGGGSPETWTSPRSGSIRGSATSRGVTAISSPAPAGAIPAAGAT